MSWRVVVVSKRGKLDYKLNQLIVREGINETRLYIQEIAVLIIENTAVSLTAYLMCELLKNKVRVIFCDHEKNPLGELFPFYGTNDAFLKLKKQIAWTSERKGEVWQEIIKRKITAQANVIKETKGEVYDNLYSLADAVSFNDESMKEGVAAKIYFADLFGNDFSRDDKNNNINKALNYGYSVILSAINREISNAGYCNLIGIKHINNTNCFNLACDFIEPLRPIIDFYIYQLIQTYKNFDTEFKRKIILILDYSVLVGREKYRLLTAIRVYVLSLLNSLEEQDKQIKWIEYEF